MWMGLLLGMVAGDRRAKEARMRQPSVFVRQLSPAEGAQLKRIARTAKQFARRQRAQILLASASGMSAPQIAAVVRSDENQVRRVVHEFNQQGMDSLRPFVGAGVPGWSASRPVTGSWRSPAPAPATTACR
jgi:CRISPR/Cas system-associated endoribonuclease Cas2